MTTISPYHGFPATKQILDRHGKPAFVIRPCYLTPFRAKAVFFTANCLAFVLMLLCFAFLADHSELSGWFWIGAIYAPWLLRPIFQELMSIIFSTSQTLTLTEQTFEARALLVTKPYDRMHPHTFTVLEHDYTRNEQRLHEFQTRQAGQKGKVILKTPIYGESFHLSYTYMGQRNDIMTIYGRKTAWAIQARLLACDEVLNKQAGGGDGYATRPEDQWPDQSGDIPEDD